MSKSAFGYFTTKDTKKNFGLGISDCGFFNFVLFVPFVVNSQFCDLRASGVNILFCFVLFAVNLLFPMRSLRLNVFYETRNLNWSALKKSAI